MPRLPIPRIERRSRDSLLWTADDEGRFPRIVGSVHQLTTEEARVYCAPCGSWEAGTGWLPSREEAEAAMVFAQWGDDAPEVKVIDRRKTR
jgi:hypothetical protein